MKTHNKHQASENMSPSMENMARAHFHNSVEVALKLAARAAEAACEENIRLHRATMEACAAKIYKNAGLDPQLALLRQRSESGAPPAQSHEME